MPFLAGGGAPHSSFERMNALLNSGLSKSVGVKECCLPLLGSDPLDQGNDARVRFDCW
jgi:hypothetical protein